MLIWFGNLKTIWKLMLGFALVGWIMAAVGYLGLSNMGKVNESVDNLNNVQLRPLMTLTRVRGLVYQMRTQTISALHSSNASDREEALSRVKDLNKQVDENREAFAKTIKAEVVQKAYDDFVRVYDDYRSYRDQTVFRMLLAGDHAGAQAAIKGEGTAKFKASIDAINNLVDTKVKIAQSKYEEADKTYADSRVQLIAIIMAGVGLGLFLGWAIARMISDGLRQANAVIQKAAAGDLTDRLTLTTKDELGLMGQAFNSMLDSLAEVVAQVRQGSETMSSAATQISSGTQDLSQRTSEQASSLEETSSAMKQMTVTVRQNADHAGQANQLGIAARNIAEQGGCVVSQAIVAMDEIRRSSRRIADIISVIDEIAFQTNLLALNAAVEAARAGEHGRGFAVVASEVRNLAQRSASAAKEIKGLIGESVQKVEQGSESVTQSGKKLEEIVASIKRVTDLMSEIAAASQQQAAGIDQVNTAVIQMDETTQQNAALVEESAAAAESLQQQAADLLRVVGFFKVGNTDARQPFPTGPVQRDGHPSNPILQLQAKTTPKFPIETNATPHTKLSARKAEPAAFAAGNGREHRRREDAADEF